MRMFLSELFAPRFCKLACGGIGVDVDTVWNEDETVLAARLVTHYKLNHDQGMFQSSAVAIFCIMVWYSGKSPSMTFLNRTTGFVFLPYVFRLSGVYGRTSTIV